MLDLADRESKVEKFTTERVTGTLNPVFEKIFDFGMYYSLDGAEADDLPSLKFNVYHKSDRSVSEMPLGELKVHIDDIDTDHSGHTIDMWFPLRKTGRMTHTVEIGELHLRFRFNRPPKWKLYNEGKLDTLGASRGAVASMPEDEKNDKTGSSAMM
jgi:hypothetical protein